MPKNNSLDNIELRSEEVQEILTEVPHWMIRWGNVLFLGLILLIILISWFVKYPDVILSEAMVTTNIPPQKEYANITGKLDAILVSDNNLVEENQPLAIIENTSNYKDVFKLKKIIDTIKVNNQSFSFPIDSIPILLLGDIDSQYAIFENNYIWDEYSINASSIKNHMNIKQYLESRYLKQYLEELHQHNTSENFVL